VYDYPDQAAHYYTIGAKLGASPLTRHLAGLEVKVVGFVIMKVLKALSRQIKIIRVNV
jgi:hypothetical protein